MKKYLPSKHTAKAIAGGVVTAAGYLAGIVGASGGLGDVTTAGWLGLVVFLGGGYGIVWAAPKNAEPPQ